MSTVEIVPLINTLLNAKDNQKLKWKNAAVGTGYSLDLEKLGSIFIAKLGDVSKDQGFAFIVFDEKSNVDTEIFVKNNQKEHSETYNSLSRLYQNAEKMADANRTQSLGKLQNYIESISG